MDKQKLGEMEKRIADISKIDISKIKLLPLPKSKNVYLIIREIFDFSEVVYDVVEEIRNELEGYGWYLTESLINPEVCDESK